MAKMESNMTTMNTHHKNHLVSSNKRLISLEKGASDQLHAPQPQTQEGVFDFEPPRNDTGEDDVQEEIRQRKVEINELRRSTIHQGSTNVPTGNPMFPVNSLGKRLCPVLTQLKLVSLRQNLAPWVAPLSLWMAW
jgi:hypothetical protein